MHGTVNYYAIMGVTRVAGAEELKLAYRRLALSLHPDRNPGDKLAESRFKLVNEAYQVLSDPKQRAEYDRERRAGLSQAGTDREPRAREAKATSHGPDEVRSQVDEIFTGLGENLRTSTAGPAPIKGADLRFHLSVDFISAVFGIKKEIIFQARTLCLSCHGTGARKDSRLTPCTACFGKGIESAASGDRTCETCLGHGVLAVDECRVCAGAGTIRAKRKLSVKIPPGCETGARLKIQSEGEPGINGGPNGDLFVVVTVGDHPIFFRQGPDIVCELPITLGQAALGAELEAPTVDGQVSIRIKPGSQHGDFVTLKGRGVPSEGSAERGDHKFILSVEIPRRLTQRQKELLAEFDSISEPDSLAARFKKKVEDILG